MIRPGAPLNEGECTTRLREQILDLSRQNQIGPLSPWFSAKLDQAIRSRYYLSVRQLKTVNKSIISKLIAYRNEAGISTVIIGMSGGVDSALTAALFKQANWRVMGVTLPIHQDVGETQRGVETCTALKIEHLHADLTNFYDQALLNLSCVDADLLANAEAAPGSKQVKIRKGNVRARLRMIALYNLAGKFGGLVGSTDNFSELGAGFWTLHGDVGDLCPIQSLLKSWEVPSLAQLNGVPESTVRAAPTDGLGIDAGDEAQLGASYLEWDLMTYALHQGEDQLEVSAGPDARREKVREAVTTRMGATWFKRYNPLKLAHPLEDRYDLLESIDRERFVPPSFR